MGSDATYWIRHLLALINLKSSWGRSSLDQPALSFNQMFLDLPSFLLGSRDLQHPRDVQLGQLHLRQRVAVLSLHLQWHTALQLLFADWVVMLRHS